MMAQKKTQWGFFVQGWSSKQTDSFDLRTDWVVRVGQIWRGQRAVDQLDLQSDVTLKFIGFGYTQERFVEESSRGGGRVGLHPLELPKQWYPGSRDFSRQSTDQYVFLDTLNAQLEMYSARRDEDTAKTLAFVSKVLDYPDNKMSFAASDRFDVIRDAWYSMDDFARVLWTLRERGAICLEHNQGNDCYYRPAERHVQPTSENMLSWLWATARRTRNVERGINTLRQQNLLQAA